MVLALAAWGLGLVATFAAVLVRWSLVRSLGPAYLPRFLAVQGLAINGALLAVCAWTTGTLELAARVPPAALVLGYGLVFFVYSLSNVDWTARKFHDAQP